MTTTVPQAGEQAIVLGAGIAGLLAARVLADSFGRVTLVDRDTLPTGLVPAHRRGVPQGHHVHALLPRGQAAFDELFPGFTDRLVAHGAVAAPASGMRFVLGGRRIRGPGHRRTLTFSRPFLETHVRDAVRALPQVRVLDRCEVLGPLVAGDRVTGVEVRRRTSDGGTYDEWQAADLVVDATGRGSRLPAWLIDLGRTPPTEQRVVVDVAYTSGRFRLRPGALDGDVAVLVGAAPGYSRGSGLFAVEGGEHQVSLTGMFGEVAPTDPEGFRAYAAGLVVPDVYEALAGAEPVGPLRTTRAPANLRRDYGARADLPTGLLAVGDALCCLNPVYGQGMTVAALEALALRDALARGGIPAPRTWFRAAAAVSRHAWDLSNGSDLQDPRVEGPRPPGSAVVNRYLAALLAGAEADPVLSAAFLAVTGLDAPPSSLMRPSVMTRVALSRARRRASDRVPVGV